MSGIPQQQRHGLSATLSRAAEGIDYHLVTELLIATSLLLS